MRLARMGVVVGLLVIATPNSGRAQAIVPTDFQDQLVVGALNVPSGFAFLPDGRCLVTEQITGRVRLIVNGALSGTDPVFTVPNVRMDNFFRGVLGIAVDPRWPASPYLYVHYATTTGKELLSRFTATGDLAGTGNGALSVSTSTQYNLITDIMDAAHNGGTLRFGLDQMLYASVGDSFFVPCAAQRIGSERGVVMRLEVRNLPGGSGGPPAKSLLTPPDNPFVADPSVNARLVWARGFRNPFRFHVDPATSDLYVADVGEASWEEVDRVPAGGGQNFGWPLFEGPDPYTTCPGVSGSGLTGPVYVYGNGGASQCIIGAGVYRRPAGGASRFPPEYEGDYFASDLYTGVMRRLKGSGASWAIAPPVPGQPAPESWGTGFAEVTDYLTAGDGALWYCRASVNGAANTGSIRRIVYTGVAGVEPAASTCLTFAPPWPVPASGTVSLAYRLPAPARVDLRIVDVGGRTVRRIEHGGELPAGDRRALWDGRDDSGHEVSTGLYFAELTAGAGRRVRRIVIAR